MPGSHDKASALNRLRRIEGQVRGITRMIEEDRYCIDVLTQMQAVKAALARAESEVLRSHAAHCVAEAIASGDEAQQRAKFDELLALYEKAKR
jgi:DNA-binding FrmR family transcriptional regulator